MPGGGIIVADYQGACLKVFSPQGEVLQVLCHEELDLDAEVGVHGVWTPSAVALNGDGTAWVVEADLSQVALMELGETDFERLSTMYVSAVDINDLLVIDDELLVLCNRTIRFSGDEPSNWGAIKIFDKESGDFQQMFDGPDGARLRGAECMTAYGPHLYVADTKNHAVKVFTMNEYSVGEYVRFYGRQAETTFVNYWDTQNGRSTAPGEFNEPFGIAVANEKLIVSERAGRRLQVLSLEGEPLQMIQIAMSSHGSPKFAMLGGLYVDGDRLWCVGPSTEEFAHANILARLG